MRAVSGVSRGEKVAVYTLYNRDSAILLPPLSARTGEARSSFLQQAVANDEARPEAERSFGYKVGGVSRFHLTRTS